MDPGAVTLILTPHGRLLLTPDSDAPPLTLDLHEPLLRAFERGSGHGLLLLGADAAGTALPPVLGWWRDFGGRYVNAVCTQATESPRDPELEQMVFAAPPMVGGEYLNAAVLRSLWRDLDSAFSLEVAESRLDVEQFLRQRKPAWNLGKIARTPTPRSPFWRPIRGACRHSRRRSTCLSDKLWPSTQGRKQESSALAAASRAARFRDMPVAERDGGRRPKRCNCCEMSRIWKRRASSCEYRPRGRGNRPPRPRATGAVGAHPPAGLGQEALLDFSMEVTLDGEVLTLAEIRALLAKSEGLALVSGRWVELDSDRLRRTIDRFREIEQTAKREGARIRGSDAAARGCECRGG